MMTEKFTPGPWTKMNATDVFEGYWNGRQVADCMVDNDINYPQQKANAALIAAAPDMYEALDNLLEAWDEWGVSSFPDPFADMARAALAKARGEESAS